MSIYLCSILSVFEFLFGRFVLTLRTYSPFDILFRSLGFLYNAVLCFYVIVNCRHFLSFASQPLAQGFGAKNTTLFPRAKAWLAGDSFSETINFSFVCRCLLVRLITCTYEYVYFFSCLFFLFFLEQIAFRGSCTERGSKGCHTYTRPHFFFFLLPTPLVCFLHRLFVPLHLSLDIIISFSAPFFFHHRLITYIHTYLLSLLYRVLIHTYTH